MQKEISNGYYRVKNSHEHYVVYISNSDSLLIDVNRNKISFCDKNNNRIKERLQKTKYESISHNDFYGEYKNILKKTDGILRVRNKLIDPEDIESRVSSDNLGRLNIKY